MLAPLLISLALAPPEPAPTAAAPAEDEPPVTDTDFPELEPDGSGAQEPPVPTPEAPATEAPDAAAAPAPAPAQPPPLEEAPAPAPAPDTPPDGNDAQPEEREFLLDERERPVGGFGGLRLRFAGVGNDFGFFMGGGGGAIFAGRFMIGGEGLGMVAFAGSAGTRTINGERKTLALTMGYGGLKLGWIFARARFLDFAILALVGGGGAAIDDAPRPESPYIDSTRMFVAEPEAVMYIKVARVFRLGVSASYRFVAHQRWGGPSGASLMGPAGAIILDWGLF